MGLFSNRCTNPECRRPILRTASFCRHCGTPATHADTNCGRCGSTIGSTAKFCWKCGADQSELGKERLFNNRWVREEEDYAIRIQECDVKGFLNKGLIVEHGTSALIFQQGRFCGTVDPGRYDVNGFLKRVNHFNQTTPTSVVLIDAGDVTLHLDALKLHSREQVDVDASFKAVVCLREPERFYTNAFKGRNILSVGYLAGSLADEIRGALQTYVGGHSVEDLYGNTALRPEVERQMQLAVEPILERIGLEMVQLRFVDFFCPTYDPIRERESELYVETRNADIDIDRLKLTQRLRKEESAEKMSQIKTASDLEDFLRQTEHELGLKDLIRDDEMDRLKRQFEQNREMAILLNRIEIEGIANDARREEAHKELDSQLGLKGKQKEFDRTQKVEDANADRTIRVDDHQQDMKERHDHLGVVERLIDLDHKDEQMTIAEEKARVENEGLKLKQFSEASAQALMAILDGPAADRIARLEELRIKEKLSPDQLIALTAADSPHVAQVLVEKYKAEALINSQQTQQMQQFMAQQQQTSREHADRLERMMNTAMGQMGWTAATRAQAPMPAGQTVVAGAGGIGAPVVINPQQPSAEKTCVKCKKSIPADSRFCPECQTKQY